MTALAHDRADGADEAADPPASRPASRPARRLTLLVAVGQVAVAALLCGLIELALMFGEQPRQPWVASLFVFGGWVYVVAGVVAWVRRPGSLFGLLMTAGGFAWLVAGLSNTPYPELEAAGEIAATIPLALVIHLLLAFPSGRLRGTKTRATVIAAYAVALIGQAPKYLFEPGPLSVADRPALVEAGTWTQRGFGIVVVLAACCLLVKRMLALPPEQRRVLAPLSLYGIVAVLVIPLGSLLGEVIGDPIARAAVQLFTLAGVPVAFAFAVSRGGFARTGEIEELGARLGDEGGDRPALTDVLARALGDPSVELLFRVHGEQGWVGAAGVAAVPPAASARQGVVEVELGGETIGAIVYDATLLTRPEEVREAASIVALALDRERLTVELRASRARLVEAGDAERRRIARDLHDGLQSRLVLLAVKAGVSGEGAVELRSGLETAIDELRALVNGVMPAELTERGLPAAVEALADRMPTAVALDLRPLGRRLPPAVETTGWFVVSEALVNAVKHARASELAVALLPLPGERLLIEVRDDGVGGAAIDRAGPGHGMRSIADRVEALGGRLAIDSPTGGGTRLTAELPCGS